MQAICAFIVIVGAYIYASGISYVRIEDSVFAVCAAPPWWVVIACILYVAQYDWYL